MRGIVLFVLSFMMFMALFTVIAQYESVVAVTKQGGTIVSEGAKRALESSSSLSTMDPGQFPPFSCRKVLDKVRNYTLDVADPNDGMMIARQTLTNPRFWVSVHNKSFDGPRWCLIAWGKYYEFEMTACFERILQASPPGSRVLDVGGNVGYFTLLSAAQGGVIVDAFEPNYKNRLRFCESLSLNRWYSEYDVGLVEPTHNSYVNLYPYGIGAKAGYFSFQESSNPGQGAFRQESNARSGLQVITLDDFVRERGWLTSRPHIAIMKVDVEGFEKNVFEGATELLKSHIVENIFVEVSARNLREQDDARDIIKKVMSAGYKPYKHGGWKGPTTLSEWAVDATLPDKIVEKTSTHGARQLNIWWKHTLP